MEDGDGDGDVEGDGDEGLAAPAAFCGPFPATAGLDGIGVGGPAFFLGSLPPSSSRCCWRSSAVRSISPDNDQGSWMDFDRFDDMLLLPGPPLRSGGAPVPAPAPGRRAPPPAPALAPDREEEEEEESLLRGEAAEGAGSSENGESEDVL